MWFQQKAAPELIGKPLVTGLPYSLIPEISVSHTGGYGHCGARPGGGSLSHSVLEKWCQALCQWHWHGTATGTVRSTARSRALSVKF